MQTSQEEADRASRGAHLRLSDALVGLDGTNSSGEVAEKHLSCGTRHPVGCLAGLVFEQLLARLLQDDIAVSLRFTSAHLDYDEQRTEKPL